MIKGALAILIVVFVIRPLIKAGIDHFKNKPGSKLGGEKPIYKYIVWIICGILAIGAIAFTILIAINNRGDAEKEAKFNECLDAGKQEKGLVAPLTKPEDIQAWNKIFDECKSKNK